MKELIEKLRQRRAAIFTEMEGVLKPSLDEARDLKPEEQSKYDGLKGDVQKFDERIADLLEMEERERKAGEAARELGTVPAGRVTREPLTYRRNGQHSYFGDVFAAQRSGDAQAQERLRRHAKEQADEIQRRVSAFEQFEEEAVDRGFSFVRGGQVEKSEMRRARRELETRDLSRTDGAGGEFVPPLWLIDEYAALARAARVHADAFNVRPLPPGTDSINIPRVTTGGATGIQTADNAAVAEQDLVTTSVSVPVRTIAGQVDVAIQLLEQSPIAFDEVIFADLIADYNAQVDVQTISGSGAAGQVLGILNVAGLNAITYTDATPTVPELYPKIADGLSQAATNRKLPPTRIFMAPRRWYWHTAALDGQNRPLVLPVAQGAMNAAARVEEIAAEGEVGYLQGLPVFIDPNIPINLGAGTNEDRVIISRYADHWLWESFLRTRVLPEVGSGTLTVRLQVYSYVAATAGRYPQATSVISGTGLVTPTF